MWSKLGRDRNSTVTLTHSLILTTYAALPPIEDSNHKNSNDFKPNLHFKSCEGQLWILCSPTCLCVRSCHDQIGKRVTNWLTKQLVATCSLPANGKWWATYILMLLYSTIEKESEEITPLYFYMKSLVTLFYLVVPTQRNSHMQMSHSLTQANDTIEISCNNLAWALQATHKLARLVAVWLIKFNYLM